MLPLRTISPVCYLPLFLIVTIAIADDSVRQVDVPCLQQATVEEVDQERSVPSRPRPETLNGVHFVNDRQIALFAEAQMNRLIRAGEALRCSELESQTEKNRCQVSVADAGTTQRSFVELYAEASKSVVAILISRKHQDHWHVVPSATGFIVSADGVIATNRHVFIQSDEYIFAMTSDYQVYPIKEVLAANSANDAALCRIDATNCPVLSLRKGVPVGETVTVISHPSGRFYSFSHGVISRRYTRPPERGNPSDQADPAQENQRATVPTDWITITADFGKGSSGGPVFDQFGNVIGMATSTQNLRVGDKDDQISQMVFRDCVAAEVILDLIETPDSPLSEQPPST